MDYRRLEGDLLLEPASATYKYLKVVVPKSKRPYLKSKLFRADLMLTDLRDRISASKESLPFPSARLRSRVHGATGREGFAEVGQRVTDDILRLIADEGRAASQFQSVLDFGCGCGRILRYLSSHMPKAEFFGADIDPEALDWCRSHLPFAKYSLNKENPPMDFADDSFDLIYGISVFTHLDESLQLRWLEELRRVARTGALVITTAHGLSRYEERLKKEQLGQLKKDGILFVRQKMKRDGLPDFYQTTFHTREYIEETWGRYFKVLTYKDRGIDDNQDAIVMTTR